MQYEVEYLDGDEVNASKALKEARIKVALALRQDLAHGISVSLHSTGRLQAADAADGTTPGDGRLRAATYNQMPL